MINKLKLNILYFRHYVAKTSLMTSCCYYKLGRWLGYDALFLYTAMYGLMMSYILYDKSSLLTAKQGRRSSWYTEITEKSSFGEGVDVYGEVLYITPLVWKTDANMARLYCIASGLHLGLAATMLAVISARIEVRFWYPYMFDRDVGSAEKFDNGGGI